MTYHYPCPNDVVYFPADGAPGFSTMRFDQVAMQVVMMQRLAHRVPSIYFKNTNIQPRFNPNVSDFWYDTDFLEFESFDVIDHNYNYSLKVDVIRKEGSFFWCDNDKDLQSINQRAGDQVSDWFNLLVAENPA